MTSVAIVTTLIAVYCMIRAHRVAAERDALAAELDRAHAAGARLAVDRKIAFWWISRVLLELNQRAASSRRVAAYCRELRADVRTLRGRRDALLQLVANISQSTPLADELAGWEAQRAALIAEVGTLRAQLSEALRDRDAHAARAVELSRRVTELERERDARDHSIDALTARVAEVMRERDAALGLVEVAAGASPGDAFMSRGRKP